MKFPNLDYASIKENTVQGRYVVNQQILDFLENTGPDFVVKTIGRSVQNRPIKSIVLGSGPKKVMMWSQMHGNESTTTKAILDLINFLDFQSDLALSVLEKCTIMIIPMLNPDGAAAYTRINANGIDLNRDAQQRTQPESTLLRMVFEEFQPDYCFNLHDQRTIFNVGHSPKPATVSFLAPAHDEVRTISETRSNSMKLIVAMNAALQQVIPGQVGRYDDSFNANCVGDTFQMLQVPTLLFEAGHAPNDYEREQTREYIYFALLVGLNTIKKNNIDEYSLEAYFNIPENQKYFYDILVKNAEIINSSLKKGDAIGLLYKEVLANGKIEFIPYVEKTGNLEKYFGHQVYDCAIDSHTQKLTQLSFYENLRCVF